MELWFGTCFIPSENANDDPIGFENANLEFLTLANNFTRANAFICPIHFSSTVKQDLNSCLRPVNRTHRIVMFGNFIPVS